MQNDSQWMPIVTGPDAKATLEVVLEIWDQIDRPGATEPPDWGPVLLGAYLSAELGSDDLRLQACKHRDAAMSSLELDNLTPRLFGGAAGLAWVCRHTDPLISAGQGLDFSEIDVMLSLACSEGGLPDYDLIGGTVGLGFYLLGADTPAGSRPLAVAAVDDLCARVDWTSGSPRWLTRAERLPDWQRALAPDGYFNLGLAHGAAGAVAFLADAGRKGLLNETQGSLLEAASEWLLRQADAGRQFSSWIAVGRGPTENSRVAWCYGELGVAVALFAAGLALRHQSITDGALEVGLAATRRTLDARVVDAGLCHGATGNAHIFNRLFQRTGRHEFRNAALYWLERTLEMRGTHGAGVAGFSAYSPPLSNEPAREPWASDASFLTGAAGIALGLLASISHRRPNWDQVLLLNF